MATTMSFKQQCPSCEAMVPIKDKSLVGRKIDCPKCKYRFVVESPGDEPEEENGASTAKKNGKPTGIKKGANGKVKAGAKKAGRDDDEDAPPKKTKKATSPVLLIGIGLAAVAVIGLVIGGLFLFGAFGSGDAKPPVAGKGPGGGGKPLGGGGGPDGGGTPDGNTPPGDGDAKKPPEVPAPVTADISNLLPNDTQAVVNLNVDKIRASALNHAALKTPGAFNAPAFAGTFGFPIDAVTRVVQGLNTDKKTVFSVMRTAKPYDRDKVIASLNLEVKGNCFRVRRPLDSLGTLLVRANQPADQLMVYLADSQTLVFADAPLMEDFLAKGGKPDYVSQPSQAPTNPPGGGKVPPGFPGPGGPGGPGGGGLPPIQPGQIPPTDGPKPSGPGGKIPPMPPPGGPGGPMPPGGPGGPVPPVGGPGGPGGPMPPGGPGGPVPPVGGPGGPGGPGGTMPPGGPGGPGGPMPPDGRPVPPGGPGGPGDGQTPPGGGTNPPPLPAGSYMTINEKMKVVLDQLEKSDKPVLLSMVAEKQSKIPEALAQRVSQRVSFGPLTSLVAPALKPLAEQFKDVDLVGISLIALNEDKLSANVTLEGRSENAAKKLSTTLTELGKVVPQVGKELLKLELAFSNPDADSTGPPNNYPGGFPVPPGGGDSRPPGFPGPGGKLPPGPGGKFPPPGGFGPPGEGRPGDTTPPDPTKTDGTITVTLRDKSVHIGMEINLTRSVYDRVVSELALQMIQLKGAAAVTESRSHVHELAAALKKYVEQNKQFPRGTVARARGGRPIDYPPHQRMSWMAELLPYLADGEFMNFKFDNDKSWDEGDNLQLAQVVIPQFMGDAKTLASPQVQYPGVSELLAPTYWVAISGVGLDAAEYDPTDPRVAPKLGIFGYDRVTKVDEIKDGLENTIALLMVPATSKTPWLAGGGSTVRGISDDPKDGDVILPFVSVQFEGKYGTYAIMGDSKVRFIAKDMDPQIFRALCTINGGEKIDDIDKIAPVVAASAPPPAPKKDAPGGVIGKPEQTPAPPIGVTPAPVPGGVVAPGGTLVPKEGVPPAATPPGLPAPSTGAAPAVPVPGGVAPVAPPSGGKAQ